MLETDVEIHTDEDSNLSERLHALIEGSIELLDVTTESEMFKN